MEINGHVQSIAIRKGRFLLLPFIQRDTEPEPTATAVMVNSFQAEAMRLGYIFGEELASALTGLSRKQLSELYSQIIPLLRKEKGDDKAWKPFYPNFPEQVMEATDVELFCNAILHYWSFGEWRPEYQKEARIPVFEDTKFIRLEKGSRERFMNIFTSILGSNASISENDREVLSWFVETYGMDLKNHLPGEIPFKEQLCAFGAACLQYDVALVNEVAQTPTDVLRILSALSGGDISLAQNTKFKSLKRSERRRICSLLESVINADDIARHGEKWKRAFHSLHIGEYGNLSPKTCEIANQLRNGKIRTFYSKVEKALSENDYSAAIDLLAKRPGELARRLDHLLRELDESEAISLVNLFGAVTEKIDTRVLVQVLAHFKTRTSPRRNRVVFPKGQSAKARLLKHELPALPEGIVKKVCHTIEEHLRDRFSTRPDLGRVWIDPRLKKCPVPLSQRSASDGLISVARGTRLPMTGKNTLRLFVWWIGQDIDLSAVFFDQSFEKLGHISYTHPRMKEINSCHSGDITHAPAPDGAAEFIDIDLAEAKSFGARYIEMSVYDFTGLTFANHTDCCAGWMTRDQPDANEIFDPKYVEQKIDLRTPSRLAIPVIFDIEEDEAIWMDLDARVSSTRPNNVESNAATLIDVVVASMNLENKPLLFDLFSLHAQARGELVAHREEAETVFALENGDVTPFDLHQILSDYL